MSGVSGVSGVSGALSTVEVKDVTSVAEDIDHIVANNEEQASIVEALRACVAGQDSAFISLLTSYLHNQNPDVRNIRWCEQLIDVADTMLINGECEALSAPLLLCLKSARSQVAEAHGLWWQKARFDSERVRQLQDDLHIELASCRTLEQLDTLLKFSVGRFPLSRLHLVIHERESVHAETQAVELAAGLLVMLPLCDGVKILGYLLVDPTGVPALSVENLANSIANVMNSFTRLQALEVQAHDLQRINASLLHMANHDELTGLRNRSGFTRQLGRMLHSASSQQCTLEMLFIDLDGFKTVNDTFGHSAGDEVLIEVARRINSLLRETDHCARFGGDEFAIIVESEAGTLSAAGVADRLLKALNLPFSVAGMQVVLGASIGITRLGNGASEGRDVEELLKQSDTAMYQAKAAGKNCYRHYADYMAISLHRRMKLENAIKQGLSNDEFTFEYQPRVNVVTRMIQGFEALVRWHPRKNDLQSDDIKPGTFIPIAEATGLIVDIDRLALSQACKQLKRWKEEDNLTTCISVNMSVQRLQQPGLVDEVRETIDFYGIAPGMIELELTESAAMDDISKNVITLKHLRLLGVNVSIDDFGTGYSSLAYLKKLPVTCLKIDQSFLKGIIENDYTNSDAQIVKTIIALGKSMGYTLVAEGVETPEQTRFLISNGCIQAQGFLYSKSLTPSAATALLKRSNNGKALGTKAASESLH